MILKFSLPTIFFLITLTSCGGLSTPSPTPVVAEAPDQQRDNIERSINLTPSPIPFQFTLPTPGAEPISGWRPPLYPVPWALSPYDHFYFTRPVAADQVNWPIADYRYGGIFFAPNIVHTGIDIDAEDEAPIQAAGAGTVVWAGWGLFTETPKNENDPYGLAVAIRHDFGYKEQQLYTVYAHMSKVLVVVGQHIETGDLLGLVGATGAVTGPHVHFEVRMGLNSFDDTFNPELWIAPPQGWGVLVGRVLDTDKETISRKDVIVRSEETKKTYLVKTYGSGGAINFDPYYNENLVLGDLPAGIYKIVISFDKKNIQTWVEIFPGQVTYFTFEGANGFGSNRPSAPSPDFLPQLISGSAPLP